MTKTKPDILESAQQKLVEVSNLRNTGWPKVIWKASGNYSEKTALWEREACRNMWERPPCVWSGFTRVNGVQEMEGNV